MKIFIEKSKTDIYRDGAWVVIVETKNYLLSQNTETLRESTLYSTLLGGVYL